MLPAKMKSFSLSVFITSVSAALFLSVFFSCFDLLSSWFAFRISYSTLAIYWHIPYVDISLRCYHSYLFVCFFFLSSLFPIVSLQLIWCVCVPAGLLRKMSKNKKREYISIFHNLKRICSDGSFCHTFIPLVISTGMKYASINVLVERASQRNKHIHNTHDNGGKLFLFCQCENVQSNTKETA